MSNRVFIMGSIGFPRGGAGANYDQYVALALKEAGLEVIILGSGKNREEDNVNGRYIYKGIEYWNEPKNIKVKYGISLKHYKEAHERFAMTKDDYFIIRDLGWLTLIGAILHYGVRHMSYVHFEDVLPVQYNKPYINPKYWTDVIKWAIKQNFIKKSLPISERLKEIDEKFGCKCLKLPIMADPDEFDYIKKERKPDVIEFVYPGAKLNGCEDNIELMLKSFARLSEKEKNRVRLHITGTSHEKLKSKFPMVDCILKELKDVLVIHEWMEYHELIKLYQSVDFLILVRFRNKATLANFPSKVPETLSFGIIPVCTEVGEYTSAFLSNGYDSIVFEADDENACYRAISKAVKMSSDEFVRLRNNARETAVEQFGYKKWAMKLSQFIKE